MVRTTALIPRGVLLTPSNKVQDSKQKIMRKGHSVGISAAGDAQWANASSLILSQ